MHPKRLVSFRPLDPANRPRPFKVYPDLEPVLLPRQILRSSRPASELLSGRRGPPAELGDELLGTLLFLAAGVTRSTTRGDERVWFRAAMSAGNLHPVEVYIVRAGVHHYQPLEHALVALRRPEEVPQAGPSAALVLSGIPFRTCWKYGERGWRHLWWDAGTILANLLAAAAAYGVPARVQAGFADHAVAQLLGIDGVEELPLVVVQLGEADLVIPPAGSLAPLAIRWLPVAPRVLRFPLADEAHAAGVLDEEAVAGWREAARGVSTPAPAEVNPPAGAEEAQRIEDVILQRGSTRVFRVERASTELLEWALPAAARAGPLDAAPAGTLIEHLVNVHDVEGAEPGGYRYTSEGGFEGRVRVADPRAAGAGLCLGQRLGGDSAYTAFHAVELAPLLGALGARGYRAAQLEAGIVAGRLALNAFALGAGATGLTFYDGLVSAYFRSDASPLLATAIGVPDTHPAPSGTPGRPAQLRGYGNVMNGLASRLRK
jgi:SagB-type dehydrogenase family enzyme